MTKDAVADLWVKLMTEVLGYETFYRNAPWWHFSAWEGLNCTQRICRIFLASFVNNRQNVHYTEVAHKIEV
jgi:hypothetical protein